MQQQADVLGGEHLPMAQPLPAHWRTQPGAGAAQAWKEIVLHSLDTGRIRAIHEVSKRQLCQLEMCTVLDTKSCCDALCTLSAQILEPSSRAAYWTRQCWRVCRPS